MTQSKTRSNNMLLSVVAILLSVLTVSQGWGGATTSASESAKPIAFVNVNVIPMDTERVLANYTVIVRGDRISEIGPQDGVAVPPDAQVIKGTGAYLIPGLADMHVHLRISPTPKPLVDPDPNHLRLYIAHGVTTVRNMAGNRMVLDWKARVARGGLLGPTIYTSGPVIGGVPPEARGVIFRFRIALLLFPVLVGSIVLVLAWVVCKLSGQQKRSRQLKRLVLPTVVVLLLVGVGMAWLKGLAIGGWVADTLVDATYIPVRTPAEAQRAVIRQQAAGYDFIKVYDFLDVETYTALLAAAKRYNLYVAGHIPEVVPPQTFFTSGQDEIAHVEEYRTYHWIGYTPSVEGDLWDVTAAEYRIDEAKIPETVALTKANDIAVGTTLVVNEVLYRLQEDIRLLDAPEYASVRPAILHTWKTQGRLVDRKGHAHYLRTVQQPFFLKLTKALHDAGVTLVLGTDVGVEGILPGYSLHRELELLVEAGLTPFQALATSTRNAAQVAAKMNGQGDWGTIAVGNRADLVLLAKNPLEDIKNTRQREGVMVRGQWFRQEELQARVDEFLTTYVNN